MVEVFRGVAIAAAALLVVYTLFASYNIDVSNLLARDVETHKSTLLEKEPHCLTFEDDMDRRVAEASNVVVVMPPKASGSSMIAFMNHCYPDNGFEDFTNLQRYMSSSLDLPKVLSRHTSSDTDLIRLLKNVPDDFLVVFVYREESDRKVSAVKMIAQSRFCDGMGKHFLKEPTMTKNETHCVIEDEEQLLQSTVGKGFYEVGPDVNSILSCNTYDAIEITNPNLMMMNFRQVDQLQPILAKYHCPKLLKRLPLHTNIASNKRDWVYVRTRENGAEVKLEEWAKSKKQFLDWAYNTDEKVQKFCRAKTRKLQNEMNRCNDQLIDLRRNEV